MDKINGITIEVKKILSFLSSYNNLTMFTDTIQGRSEFHLFLESSDCIHFVWVQKLCISFLNQSLTLVLSNWESGLCIVSNNLGLVISVFMSFVFVGFSFFDNSGSFRFRSELSQLENIVSFNQFNGLSLLWLNFFKNLISFQLNRWLNFINFSYILFVLLCH